MQEAFGLSEIFRQFSGYFFKYIVKMLDITVSYRICNLKNILIGFTKQSAGFIDAQRLDVGDDCGAGHGFKGSAKM